jgi:hypothetical protein
MKSIILHSPKGILFLVSNVDEFCKTHFLIQSPFKRMLNGYRKFYKGWSIYTPSEYNFPKSKNYCN